jgi:FtsH-binding integral membrane protein
VQEQGSSVPYTYEQTQDSIGLLTKVWFFLAFSMVFTAVGGYVGVRLGPGVFFAAAIGSLVCAVAVRWARNVPVLNVGLLYGLAFCIGVTLGPLIMRYVNAGLGSVVYEAAGLTAAMAGRLSIYALTTRRDFARIEHYLFLALIGLIIAGVALFFLQVPLVHLVVSLIGAFVFCLFIVVDVQKSKHLPNTVGNAVVIAVNVYLDVVNLFLYLLRILGLLGRGNK